MDRSVQRRLLLAMDSIQDRQRLRDYGLRLRANNPSQDQDITRTVDCYESTHQADQCLQLVVSGGAGPLATSQLSPDLRFYARGIVGLGEQALRERWTLQQFVLRAYAEQLSYTQGLAPEEREALNDLSAFYAREFPDPLLQDVRRRLTQRPEWRSRLEAYDRRQVAPATTPVEPRCSSSMDWERHYLQVTGLSYSVPVFTPRNRGIPWAFYESSLLAQFERLKIFLISSDFERLLRPGNGLPNLVIYLGGGFPGSDATLNQCGFRTDDRGGEYSIQQNYIMSNAPFRGFDAWATEVLRHEIGHAIYFRLLTEDHRESVRSLFEATKTFAESDADYIPNSHFADTRYADGRRRYAMKNDMEFFAEMVAEYVSSRMEAESYGGRPFNVRMAIMSRFFAEDGLHPEVFSREAVEAAFRAESVPFQYPAQGYVDLMPSSIFNSSRGWGAELFIGGRGVSGGHVLTYGGGVYLQPGFQQSGSFGLGIEGNVGLMPASWLGLELLGRIGFRGDFSGSQPTGVAGAGLRLRLRPSSVFQFQGFVIPQVDMNNGRRSVDIGGGFGFTFH